MTRQPCERGGFTPLAVVGHCGICETQSSDHNAAEETDFRVGAGRLGVLDQTTSLDAKLQIAPDLPAVILPPIGGKRRPPPSPRLRN
jgi:hypothetical protein